MIARLAAIPALLLFVLNSPPAIPDCDRYGQLRIPNRLQEEAVIKISSGTQFGTAFLIDRRRGIFVTARHVVKSAIGNASQRVTGSVRISDESPSLSLSVIAHDMNLDMALLKLDENQRPILEMMIEFELPFDQQEPGEVAIISMAESAMEAPKAIRETFGYFKLDGQKLLIDNFTQEGTSGAPIVLDKSGLVIGVVVSDKGSYQTVGVTTKSISEFLVAHTIGSLPDQIVELLYRAESRTNSAFRDIFWTFIPNYFTNLEIATMIHLFRKLWDKHQVNLPTMVGTCSLFDAASLRELGLYSGEIHMMAHAESEKDGSLAYYARTQAIVEQQAARYDSAGVFFVLAADRFLEAAKQLVTSSQDSKSLSDTGADKEFLEATARLIAPDVTINDLWLPNDQKMRNRLARDLYFYQDATLNAQSVGWKGSDSTEGSRLIAATAFGTQFEGWGPYRAYAYEALGDMLVRTGWNREGAAAFEEAWRIVHDDRLIEKYNNAVLRDPDDYPPSIGHISKSGRLDREKLTEILNDLIRS